MLTAVCALQVCGVSGEDGEWQRDVAGVRHTRGEIFKRGAIRKRRQIRQLLHQMCKSCLERDTVLQLGCLLLMLKLLLFKLSLRPVSTPTPALCTATSTARASAPGRPPCTWPGPSSWSRRGCRTRPRPSTRRPWRVRLSLWTLSSLNTGTEHRHLHTDVTGCGRRF